jgi:hypothetical protein
MRGYRLAAAHVNVLVTEDHPAHLAPLAQMVAGIGGAIERVLAAYRSGGGVPYPMFGTAFRKGGTVIRADAIRELAGAAGFVSVDVLPVNAGFFRIYRLSPP